MHRYSTLLWIIVIILGLSHIQSKKGNQGSPIKLTHKALQSHAWLQVKENTAHQSKDFLTRKLVFTSPNSFEIRVKYEFSGSKLRIPGNYSLRDSILILKSANGKKHIGNIRIHNPSQLRVEWTRKNLIHGKGIEIYQTKDNTANPQPKLFSSRVLRIIDYFSLQS